MEGADFGITRQWADIELQPKGQSVETQYPDYDFHVENIKLFQDSASPLEISAETRLKRVAEQLAETCGGDFAELKDKAVRQSAIINKKRYLATNITLPDGQRPMRRHLVTKTDAYFAVAGRLEEMNHPTVQIMRAIEQHFNAERQHSSEIWKLWEDMLEVSAWPLLQQEYELQIKDAMTALAS